MFMKDKNNESCALYCSCGCTDGVILKVDKDDDWNTIELSLVSDNFYLHSQNKISFKDKLKRIWNIIKNEEYYYFDIMIEEEDLKEFKEFVNNINFDEDNENVKDEI